MPGAQREVMPVHTYDSVFVCLGQLLRTRRWGRRGFHCNNMCIVRSPATHQSPTTTQRSHLKCRWSRTHMWQPAVAMSSSLRLPARPSADATFQQARKQNCT